MAGDPDGRALIVIAATPSSSRSAPSWPGFGVSTSVRAGFYMSQIGEFGFIIAAMAAAAGSPRDPPGRRGHLDRHGHLCQRPRGPIAEGRQLDRPPNAPRVANLRLPLQHLDRGPDPPAPARGPAERGASPRRPADSSSAGGLAIVVVVTALIRVARHGCWATGWTWPPPRPTSRSWPIAGILAIVLLAGAVHDRPTPRDRVVRACAARGGAAGKVDPPWPRVECSAVPLSCWASCWRSSSRWYSSVSPSSPPTVALPCWRRSRWCCWCRLGEPPPTSPATPGPAQSWWCTSSPARAWQQDRHVRKVEAMLPGLGSVKPVKIEAWSAAAGRTLGELNLRGRTGATVVGLSREEGTDPPPDRPGAAPPRRPAGPLRQSRCGPGRPPGAGGKGAGLRRGLPGSRAVRSFPLAGAMAERLKAPVC